jgi:hypothetical protein
LIQPNSNELRGVLLIDISVNICVYLWFTSYMQCHQP